MKSVEKVEKRGNFVGVASLLKELERDVTIKQPMREKATFGKEAVLEVLTRAADDTRFLARLADNPEQALKEYTLTLEERAALACGDLRKIESWVGKLDNRLSTWIWCRLQQEKW